MKRQVLFTILLLMSLSAFSHDIEVANADGVMIYYNYSDDGNVLAVTYRGTAYSSYSGEYAGSIAIPETVNYNNVTYSVTSISNYAFCNCSGLISIEIPQSVKSIGESTFSGCSNLISITIPNHLKSIGAWAFSGCSDLTSINIPNSVTSIGSGAFYDCSGLTSVTIPSNVTEIGYWAFSDCSGLTSINIPNSVTIIGNYAFSGCSGLTTIEIPNSVTSIGEEAFYQCTGLTSVKIPQSVTSIGGYAFYQCSGLTSVTIPNSVESIGGKAFDGADISTIISQIEKPFTIEGKTSNLPTFSQNTFNNATLYVPKGTIEKYKATEGWKEFLFIEEGPEKCATPTISIKDGKPSFSCDTEGVTYCCQVTFETEGNDDNLPVKYTVSVYAKKDGYENSKTVTKEIVIKEMKGDMNGDGVLSVTDVGMLITKILSGE